MSKNPKGTIFYKPEDEDISWENGNPIVAKLDDPELHSSSTNERIKYNFP